MAAGLLLRTISLSSMCVHFFPGGRQLPPDRAIPKVPARVGMLGYDDLTSAL
jgi:hypothetical protein